MLTTMTDPLHWQIDAAPSGADLALIADSVVSHGRALAGSTPQPLASLVRDGGALVGGASGRIEFGRLFIQYLWVREDHRRQGLGTRLLAMIEQAAAERGCVDALIETLADDTAQMYSRRGYESLAVIPGYIGHFTRHVLLKRLAD